MVDFNGDLERRLMRTHEVGDLSPLWLSYECLQDNLPKIEFILFTSLFAKNKTVHTTYLLGFMVQFHIVGVVNEK